MELLASILTYTSTVLGIAVMVVGGAFVVFLLVIFAARISRRIFDGDL